MTRSMKRQMLACVLLAGAIAIPALAADYPAEFEPVVRLFSGLSYADHGMIQRATTPDFLLLELGEVWDREFLLSVVKPTERERRNFFGIISVQRFDGVTLVNYWNKAVISAGGESTTRAWLESIVAVDTGSGWRLKQMHSTRIEPSAIPEDVELEEHMLARP